MVTAFANPSGFAADSRTWSETLGRRIAEQRSNVQRRTAECRARLDRFAADWSRQVELHAVAPARDENQALSDLAQLEHELDTRRTQLHELELQLERDQLTLRRQATQLDDDSAEVARQQAHYQSRTAALEQEWTQLAAERERTQRQRQRLAEEGRQQRKAQSSTHDLEALRGKVRQVSAERDQWREQFEHVERQLQAAVTQAAVPVMNADSGELITLRGKYELAMADLKDLRRRNTDLEHARSHAPTGVDNGAMDWESQKRRMLAVFEAEELDGPIQPNRQQDRLTIEGTILITDQMIQERDNEIAELKRLLNEQSQNVGQLAVGAAAIGQLFESDEIIHQQRQHLQEMEGALQQKLCAAEIEISRDRAKLARDRAEVEENRREVESQRLKADREAPGAKKAGGGNWLARLGIKADEP